VRFVDVTERNDARTLARELGRRELLLAAAAVAGGGACGPGRQVMPVSRPDPAIYGACLRGSSLSILTWNIWMMPPWTATSPRNEPRAAAVAATLLEENFDIVCLQKVFDGGARAVLEGALAKRYPHRYGPANNWCSLALNSGVWVLSKHPLADYQEIAFDVCDNVECFSRKGALLLSGSCGATPFRVVATHLQGEEGPEFTPLHQCLRDEQAIEIRERLLEPHLEPGVPFFLCGDFGTPRLTDDGRFETASYRRLLATFGAENGPEVRITYDDSPRDNDLAEEKTGRKNELDYIFVRANGCDVKAKRQVHHFKGDGWDSRKPPRHDLSYRYAVSAELTFGQAPLGPFTPLPPISRAPAGRAKRCRAVQARGS
jgi:endonuclease/exonuclease/phosphatase family metal-dependent hydrolase